MAPFTKDEKKNPIIANNSRFERSYALEENCHFTTVIYN
jgi:hypothetical protein